MPMMWFVANFSLTRLVNMALRVLVVELWAKE